VRPALYPPEQAPAQPDPFTTREQWLEEIVVGQLGLGPETIQRNQDVLDDLAALHAKHVTTLEELRQERQKAFEKAHEARYTPEQAEQLARQWQRRILPHEQALLEEELAILEKLRPRLEGQEAEQLARRLEELRDLWQRNNSLEHGAP